MRKYIKKIGILWMILAIVFAGDITGMTGIKAEAATQEAGYSYSTNVLPTPSATTSTDSVTNPSNVPQEYQYDSIAGFRVADYSATTLSLQWTSLGNGTGYNIYRKSQYDADFVKIGTVANQQGASLSYKDTTFRRGISFTYKLVAYRTDNTTGTQIEGTSMTLTQKVELPTVTFSSVSRSGTKAKLTWKKVSGVNGYEIYRKNSGGSFKKTKTITNASTAKWTSTKVSKKKTTKYKVRAFVTYNGRKVYGSFSETLQTYTGSQQKLATKFKKLQKQYPNGKYWNHVGKSKYSSATITSKPCDHSTGNGLETCNHYNCPNGILGYQCYGFAWKMSDLLYGRSAKIKNFTGFSKCKAGDVIRYSGHSVIITEKHSNYVVVGECNYGNTCVIKWGRKVYSSELSGAVYSRRYR